MQSKKRIPVGDNVAYTHWEMPDLTGVKRRIAQRLNELEKEDAQQEEPEVDLTPPTAEELAQIREEARQEGYSAGFSEGQTAGNEDGRAEGYQAGEKTGQEAGFQAGYQRGLDQSEQEVDQQLARLQSIIEQLQGPLAALDQDVENALLSLVDLVSRAILRREIKLDRSFLTEILQEAVAALPAGHQRLRISLNPEDLNLAEAACQDLLEDYRLVGDPEITLGGAKIETLQSLVDSTLENRYKKVIDKLISNAYQPSVDDFEPLPANVLATPDSTPLEEASFTEPKVSEPKVSEPQQEPQPVENELALESDDSILEAEPPIEPVAQVSLQRGKAPRHQQPLESLANQTTEINAPHEGALNQEALLAEEFGSDQADAVQEEALLEPEVDQQQETNDVQDQVVDSFDEQTLDEPTPLEEPAASESTLEELTEVEIEDNAAEVTDFLEEFAEDETESTKNAEPSSDTEPAIETASTQEDSSAEEASDWSPESVHDDRYLEDVLEKTWLDDMQEDPVEKPLDIIPDDEQGN